MLFRGKVCFVLLQFVSSDIAARRACGGRWCLPCVGAFRGDLDSCRACERGCFHNLAKFDVGAAKASCPFHVSSGQHWKKQSLDCCNPFFGCLPAVHHADIPG
uniref:Putative secreted protein n=1 Tax=Ixodes scapularis TaxID=6945 RepID=A0A4D5RX78_IXOSC